MDSRRLRTEIIRFGLLVTITVALISVATRHHGSEKSTSATGHPGGTPSASATAPGTSGPSSAPATGASPGATSHRGTGSGRGAGAGASGAGAPGNGGGSGGGAGTAGGSGGQPVATLPRTGGSQAAELAALAAVLIAGGSLSMSVSRPRRRVLSDASSVLR